MYTQEKEEGEEKVCGWIYLRSDPLNKSFWWSLRIQVQIQSLWRLAASVAHRILWRIIIISISRQKIYL